MAWHFPCRSDLVRYRTEGPIDLGAGGRPGNHRTRGDGQDPAMLPPNAPALLLGSAPLYRSDDRGKIHLCRGSVVRLDQ